MPLRGEGCCGLAGPLGTLLGSAQWKRASSRGEAGTSGFLSVSDSDHRSLQSWDKRSVFITIPKKGNDKECSNYRTSALISHASKVMLKILQARLQQYVNRELADTQAGFRKGRGTRDQIANIRCIIEKAREFQKNIYFCFIDYAKAFDCVVTVLVLPNIKMNPPQVYMCSPS